MAQIRAYRQLVVARAGGACEYCRLLQAATGMTFHIQHIADERDRIQHSDFQFGPDRSVLRRTKMAVRFQLLTGST